MLKNALIKFISKKKLNTDSIKDKEIINRFNKHVEKHDKLITKNNHKHAAKHNNKHIVKQIEKHDDKNNNKHIKKMNSYLLELD